MIQRIKKFEPLENFLLYVEFDDGKKVIYDVKDDIKDISSYSVLQTTYKLFEQVQLDKSRTCIFWNEDIDLPSDIIYEYGKEVNV